MRNRFLLAFLLAAATCWASAQAVRLEFGTPGAKAVWLSPTFPDREPESPLETDQTATEVTTVGQPGTAYVCVWDRETGNLAARKLSVAGKLWKVGASDYSAIAKVRVRVEHAGQPVSSANVTVLTGGSTTNRLIGPSDQGEILLFGHRPGLSKVTVQYSFDDQTKSLPPQTFDLKLKRDQAEPVLTLVVSDAVETFAAPSKNQAKADEPEAKKTKESGGPINWLGSLLIYLLGAAAAVAGAFALLKYLQKNQTVVEDKLKQMGVKVPDPEPQVGPDAPATPIAPEPIKPIVLDDSAPNQISGAAGLIVGQVANPRLVTTNGEVILITEGNQVIGREESADVPLPGESTVSRRHVQITRTGDEVILRDLKSTNGTFVNGVKCSESEVTLRPGDQVHIGAVSFRYEV